MTRTSILTIIPTYNERESLPGALGRLIAAVPETHVLVVDDASPDGTGEWADEQARDNARIHVLHRQGKGGLGPAYIAGFEWGLNQAFDVLCEMDADGSHRPEQLPRLLEAIEQGADVAIGSRWVRGGAVHNWPRRREALSRAGNIYTRFALGLSVADATAGFRAFRAPLLSRLMAEDDIASQGYCFQVDMTRRAARAGATIREVPIDFDERELGVSKMSGDIVKEAMARVTLWGLERTPLARLFSTRDSHERTLDA